MRISLDPVMRYATSSVHLVFATEWLHITYLNATLGLQISGLRLFYSCAGSLTVSGRDPRKAESVRRPAAAATRTKPLTSAISRLSVSPATTARCDGASRRKPAQ